MPEQSCCRNDGVFPNAKAATGVIPGKAWKGGEVRVGKPAGGRTYILYVCNWRKASQGMRALYVVAVTLVIIFKDSCLVAGVFLLQWKQCG